MIARLETSEFDAAQARKTLLDITANSRVTNWDEAAQTYLACVALYNGVSGQTSARKDDPVIQALNAIRERLRFKSESHSTAYNSPHDYDPAPLLEDFKRLHGLLNAAGGRP